MEKESGKAFDMYLFKRVLAFTRPYTLTFLGTALSAILLTVFSILTPLILKEIVDVAITQMKRDLLLALSLAMLGVLIGQVVCQLLFTYYANWLGESVIMDMRTRLFRQMIGFRMKYFSNSSIGGLVTRCGRFAENAGSLGYHALAQLETRLTGFCDPPHHPVCHKTFPKGYEGRIYRSAGTGFQFEFLCSGAHYRDEDCTVVYTGTRRG